MKIGLFVSYNETGGSLNQTLGLTKLISKLKINEKDQLCIISDKKINAKEHFNEKFEVYHFKKTWFDKILFFIFGFFKKNKYYSFKISNPFQNFVKKNDVDLLIFSNPSFYSLYCEDIYYAINIWNTEITKYKNFKEFKSGGYHYQKRIINNAVENAFKIIVFTEENKLDLINEYNCKPDDIKILNLTPILPTKYKNNKDKNFLEIFNKFTFDKNKQWFFYPSQFWSHKNHIYILNAMRKIDQENLKKIGFIFCGRDKGNLDYIKNKIKEYKFEEHIKILGHIDDNELISIYKYSDAMIIPTYLGRSSLPLLEGIYFNKKIYYSKGILDKSLIKYVEEFDLNDPQNLADKITKFNNNKIEHNYEKLCSDNFFIETYESIIDEFKLLYSK